MPAFSVTSLLLYFIPPDIQEILLASLLNKR